MPWNSPATIGATLQWGAGPQVTVTALVPDVPGAPESIVQRVMWNSEDITATRRPSPANILPTNKLIVTLMCVGGADYGDVDVYYNHVPGNTITVQAPSVVQVNLT
jgi:hypothetical protein